MSFLKPKKIYIDLMNHSPFNIGNRNTSSSLSNSDLSAPVEQKAAEEGKKAAVKETVKLETQNQEKLDVLLTKTEVVLLRIGNIFPVLKSELIIDSSKVTIIHRPFFFTESIHTITIKNLTSVYIETVPFFATINMKDINYVQNNFRIRWISKGKAEKARRIMTGLMQVAKEGIDLKSLTDENLAEKLEEIGKIRETAPTESKA